MARRREGVAMLVAALLLGGTVLLAAAPQARGDLAGYVRPFNGTQSGSSDFGTGGGAGNTYPGAVAPFGMLQWSPDSVPSTDNFAGGYTYTDHRLRGFSLTHVSGAGCASYGDFPILPTTLAPTASPAKFGSSDLSSGYAPRFDHASESASPGSYSVTLDPGTRAAIGVQLTASARSGIGEFDFPSGLPAGTVLINAGGSQMADTRASVQIDPRSRTVTGAADSGLFCYQHSSYRLYFAARFDRPFAGYGTWDRQLLLRGRTGAADADPAAIDYKPIPGGPSSLSGDPSSTAQAGAFVSFDTAEDPVVRLRVAVSFVSTAGALRNLETGPAGFDVAAARRADRLAWDRALSRITVLRGPRGERSMLYTALYHALLEPSLFSDADGSYLGMDGHVRRVAGQRAQYANFSGWDVYRSEIPLLAMLDPGRGSDMAESLVHDAEQSGCLPKWSLANGQTNTMVGDPADAILAGAYAFGARGFDATGALQRMLRGAQSLCASDTNGDYVERQGLLEYEALGYVPSDEDSPLAGAATVFDPATVWGSAATTLEYATDDFALSRLAAALGDHADAARYQARAGDWRNVFDPISGYVEPRAADGRFPDAYAPTSESGFVEGDGAQYTWMVPFDLRGLFGAMGGGRRAAARLDGFFAKLDAGPTSPYAYLGNEPTLQTPWEYDWLGEPWRTQALVRRALLTLYSTAPGGFPGNDDLGEMSSWWVLGALGLYPEIPGTDVLALGSPLFPRVALHLGRHRLMIEASAAGAGRPYVHRLVIDGRPWPKPWLTASVLRRVRSVRFALGPRPDRRWGAAAADAPPSFGSS